MKKFICAILICLITPITFLLSGCDSKNYDVKDFYTSYKNIASTTSNLFLNDADNTYGLDVTAYKIDVNYSLCPTLSTLVEDSSTPYYYLKYFYQQLLDDTLSPVHFYGEAISNSKKVSDSQGKQLFKCLEEVKEDYEDIDYYVGILMTSLNATNDTTVNLSCLKIVFSQYEEALDSANKLSNIVSTIYFNKVLSNSNFDYSTKSYSSLTEADLTRITIDTRTKMYYYKSVYANAYYQLYVREGDLAETLSSTTNAILPNYKPYTYIKNISSLNAKPMSTLTNSLQSIHTNAVSLFNLQKTFDVAYKHFNTATENVALLDLTSASSANEINYGEIIVKFAEGMATDSYEILSNLIDLIFIV